MDLDEKLITMPQDDDDFSNRNGVPIKGMLFWAGLLAIFAGFVFNGRYLWGALICLGTLYLIDRIERAMDGEFHHPDDEPEMWQDEDARKALKELQEEYGIK